MQFSLYVYRSVSNEMAMLTLQKSYSLSVLMYAVPALTLSERQID